MKKQTLIWNKPWARLALGLAASVFFLYLAFRNITLGEVWLVLRKADVFWTVMALLSVAATTIFKVFRWQVLLGAARSQVSFAALLAGLLSGQMLNTIMPVRVGDIQRAYAIGGMGPGRTFVFGTIVVEKILDLIFYLLIFVMFLVLIPIGAHPPSWLDNSAVWLAIGALCLTIAAFLMSYYRDKVLQWIGWILKRLPERFAGYLEPRIRSGLHSLDILHSWKDLLIVSLWSTAIWGMALLTNYLAGQAMGLDLPWSAWMLLLVALQAGISLANIPGRIGIFEYICVLSLSLYAVAGATALGYGLLLHAIVFIPTILAGVFSFWILGMKPSTVQS